MNKNEIIEILKSKNANEIYKKADKIRREHCGNIVHLRALIEFSNFCKKQCLYCGINSKNKNVKRYRLSENEIIETAKQAAKLGFKTIVLQSGEDDFFDTKKMCSIIEKIKELNVALTLSIGEKTKEEYRAYKNSGADRFLLRIETTDENLYKKLHPNSDFKNRIKCLYNLKELGFETGTGVMIGLPEQTIESIADDILFFKKLNADMVGLGPFISHCDTELKDSPNGSFELALKALATTRILMPKINIPATTAMETLLKDGRKIALTSGANVVMPNITPLSAKSNYSIYPNKQSVNANNSLELEKLKSEIGQIGDTISKDFGTSKNFIAQKDL